MSGVLAIHEGSSKWCMKIFCFDYSITLLHNSLLSLKQFWPCCFESSRLLLDSEIVGVNFPSKTSVRCLTYVIKKINYDFHPQSQYMQSTRVLVLAAQECTQIDHKTVRPTGERIF
jgi:hypothetical protein